MTIWISRIFEKVVKFWSVVCGQHLRMEGINKHFDMYLSDAKVSILTLQITETWNARSYKNIHNAELDIESEVTLRWSQIDTFLYEALENEKERLILKVDTQDFKLANWQAYIVVQQMGDLPQIRRQFLAPF